MRVMATILALLLSVALNGCGYLGLRWLDELSKPQGRKITDVDLTIRYFDSCAELKGTIQKSSNNSSQY